MAPTTLSRLTLGLALALVTAAPAAAQNHPRLGLYGHHRGNGAPYTTGGSIMGPYDTAVLDAMSRYDEIIIGVSPITEYRPELLDELRRRNPNISLLAYVLGQYVWDVVDDGGPTIHYPTLYQRLVRELDGYLYNQAGGMYSQANINLAKRDLLGRYVVAEAIAELWHGIITRGGLWDGIFIDLFCDGILWTQTPGEFIDFQRAGYPSEAAFDAGWRAGTEAMAARLRQRAGPAFALVGNCGQGTKYTTFNGWMRENFPHQNGGTWFTNMFRAIGGYITDEESFRRPTHNYLFAAADDPTQPFTAASCREVRFVLGSAALGSGFGIYAPANIDGITYPYQQSWWYDEYSVDLTTGRSSTRLAHTGWLGEAIGPYYQMIWLGPGPDASTNPGFEADVTSGWQFDHVVPATVSRDTTTAGSGRASARLDLPARAPSDHNVNFSTSGRLNVVVGQQYSATFWAKASARCTISVVAGLPYGVVLGGAKVPIGTGWKRYQAEIVATGSGSVGLQFFLGETPGQFWLDDVHFQQGVTHVYRRDFQNGIVLVNPRSSSFGVTLEREYRRILGTVDPIRNDGSPVTSILIPPNDAAFLIGDSTAPAGVVDLHPLGP